MKILHVPEHTPPSRSSLFTGTIDTIKVRSAHLYLQVKFLGYSHNMDEYEQRKLRIFNQLNFIQALAGLIIPMMGLALPGDIPAFAWLVMGLPALVSIAALTLNHYRKYEASLIAYFILYPFFTSIIYYNGINPGVELHFILYIILSVFFLKDVFIMLFTTGFSMVSFFVLSVVLEHYQYQVAADNKFIYLLNKAVSLGFIFYGLFLVKKENTTYQFNILEKQKKLHDKNVEIELQKEELADLNAFKTKMFSIISHDLKSPMYGLRTLFQNMHQYNLPAEEVKEMVPDVLKDLNYTTSLLENLLQWSKSQMQSEAANPQEFNMTKLIQEVAGVLRLSLESKCLDLQLTASDPVYVYADRNMIHLVLRNLLSNAIKFTPASGTIEFGYTDFEAFIEVYVQDSGVGISGEALKNIKKQIFYTTKGTSSETGTGLGLMLCNEFLAKNNSQLQIESTPGEGSIFSFTLPKVDMNAGTGNEDE